MADKGNPILKENLCCMLFFLLLPLYALTLGASPVGIGIFIAAAALLILRFAVFDKPDAALTVGHFGWYLTVSMIASMGIRIAAASPVKWRFAGISTDPEVLGRAVVVLFSGVMLFVLGGLMLKYNPARTGKNLVRTVTDHAALACVFWGGMGLFGQNGGWQLMLFFALFFVLCDCYEQQRRMGWQRHTGVMLAAAVLYCAMLLIAAFCPKGDAVLLFGENGVFGQLQAQFADSAVLWLLPVLYGLTAFAVCCKGSYAAQEVRYLAAYLVFAAPLYRGMLAENAGFVWILPLILTGVLLFCLFYPKNPSGAIEQRLSAHKEYRVAYAGIFLLLCMPVLKVKAYLTAFVLAAFGILLFTLLQAKKLPKGSILWQIVCGGAAIAVWSMLFSAEKAVSLQLACGMTALLSEAALWLYTHGRQKRADGWITAGIGVMAVMLQLAFLI